MTKKKKGGDARKYDFAEAIEKAVASGNTTELFRQLELGSGLPGPRVNTAMAVAFGHDCARHGPKVDKLTYKMAKMTPEQAPGATSKEFLVVCGVLGVGARAMVAKENDVRDEALLLLEEKADDTRFRVRDAVPLALAMIGSKMKDELGDRVEPWMDRYFHAAAVIRALSEPAWLETYALDNYYRPINLLHDAFVLGHEAPRSAFRYPGHKALLEALGWVPRAIARRFVGQMFDRFTIWAEYVRIPEMRDLILKNVEVPEYKKAWKDEIARIKEKIDAGKAPPRDPTLIRHGMRGRGKKRVHPKG